MKNDDLILYGGTYLNKGGAAIAYGTFRALRDLNISFHDIIDPEPFFPFDSLELNPVYRYSHTLSIKPMESINLTSTYKPFIKCLINSHTSEVNQLKGLPIWHIGDSPFSDSRSVLSLIGQIVALESLRKVIKSKVIIGGVSIDIPKTDSGMYVSKKYFRNYYFYVRGKNTLNNLLALGVPEENMCPIFDFAYQLDSQKSSKTKDISYEFRNLGKPIIALCLRDYSKGEKNFLNIQRIRALISKLEKDYIVYFVPTSYAYLVPENDYLFAKEILRINEDKIINIRDLNPHEIIEIFSNFDAVISSRLHGAVYATLANIPTVHLYESSKSLEVLGDVFGHLVSLIKISDFIGDNNLENIYKILDNMINRQDDIRSKMRVCKDSAKNATLSKLTENLLDGI